MTSAASIEWVQVGQVTGLHIYPIKSCGGISLEDLELDALGPRFDRRFLVVDESGNFVTQRTFNKMACFKLKVSGQSVLITSGDDRLEIDTGRVKGDANDVLVKIWNEELEALDCGPEAADLFSSRLGKPLRLAYMDPLKPRVRDKGFAFQVGFADSMPLLVINQASLSNLNEKLKTPIPQDRFRSNITFDSALPWLEEYAESMRIGDIHLTNGRKCDRCVITTIDQETGTRSSAEPLASLRGLRPSEDKKIYFGMRYSFKEQGAIKIGDPICIAKSNFTDMNAR